jgi:hypothetical protein
VRIARSDEGRHAVAVAFVQEFQIEDRSTANYDAVVQRLGDETPEGAILHTAGFDDEAGVFRIFDVWESREHAERFMKERLQPILDELMQNRSDLQPPTREAWYELHDIATA